MRILHLVSAPTLTGPAGPALGLARGQADLGADVAIAYDTVRTGTMAIRVEDSGVRAVTDLRLCTRDGPWGLLGDRRRLRRLVEGFDLVHAHTSHDHTLAVLAGLGPKLVRSIHHPRGCHRRGLQGGLYRRTAGFTVVAEAHRALLQDNYPSLDPERIAVMPGAVDIERFSPNVDGGPIREEHGFDTSRFVFGVVARIKPGRGHSLFLEALAEVRSECPRVAGVLIGKGEGEPEIDAEIVERGLGAHVRRLGFRDRDLPEAIRSCDVTVLMEEGNDASCRAILESMACGIPVLGAGHPAIAEALSRGGGRVFEPRDRAGLVSVMKEALRWTPTERGEEGQRARIVVEEHHSDRIRAKRVLAAYRRWGLAS